MQIKKINFLEDRINFTPFNQLFLSLGSEVIFYFIFIKKCTEFLKGRLTDDSRRMAMKKTTTSHYFTKLMHFSDFYKQKKGGCGGLHIFKDCDLH